MDTRDLFAIIGRLYAANVELTEEANRLEVQLKKSDEDRKAMAEEIHVLRNRNKDLADSLGKVVEENEELKREGKIVRSEMIVDARREEDLLAEMMGNDPMEELEAMMPAKKRA